MKSRMKITTAIALIVTTWRLRYALAPSWMAPAISCIRSFPGEDLITERMRKKAKASPATAQSMDSQTPEVENREG